MSAFLIIISLLFMAAAIFFALRYNKIHRHSAENTLKIEQKYKERLNDIQDELNRQNYVIADYKKRLQLEDKVSDPKITSYTAPVVSDDSVKDVLSEKQKLEKEKEKFKQKNQKLWEQSLAVHKEKERIDALRKEIEIRHKEVTDSINYAQRIQQALLPAAEVLEALFSDYFILYRPREIVSGDFFWAKQNKNKVMAVAADSTGHGVPGAFMSLLGISFLNEITSRNSTLSSAEILEELRDKVIKSLKQEFKGNTLKDGMDMVMCIIDYDTMQLEFAGANNNIFLWHDNNFTEYKGTKNPISVYPRQKPFENHVIGFDKNDVLFMYSDGYIDQFGEPYGQKLKKKYFGNLLHEYLKSELPMPEMHKRLDSYFDEWRGSFPQVDDVLVFGVKL